MSPDILNLMLAAAVGWALRHFNLVGPKNGTAPAPPPGPAAEPLWVTEVKALLNQLLQRGK